MKTQKHTRMKKVANEEQEEVAKRCKMSSLVL